MAVTETPNHFAVDYQAGEHITDLNNPPAHRYVYNEFPKILYAKTCTPSTIHAKGQTIVVNDKEEEKKLVAKGWVVKPPVNQSIEQ